MESYAYYEKRSLRTRLFNLGRGLFRIPVFERMLVDKVNGRPSGSSWAKAIPPEYTYAKDTWRTVERHGLHLRLDLSNANDHWAYFGPVDKGDEVLFGLVKPGHVIIDIGGNIGLYAMRFAKLASRGRVITFEPDEGNFRRLQEHLSMNGLPNLQARQRAIGAVEATHRLHRVVATNSGMNRIITGAEVGPDVPYTEVHVVPLQKGLEGFGIDKVDLMKIDVEGFEDEVLKGAEAIIKRDRPVLFVEVYDSNLRENGSSAHMLVDRVMSWGYRVFEAVTNEEFTPSTDLNGRAMDILCLPR